MVRLVLNYGCWNERKNVSEKHKPKDMDWKRVLYQNLNMHIHTIKFCEHIWIQHTNNIPAYFFFNRCSIKKSFHLNIVYCTISYVDFYLRFHFLSSMNVVCYAYNHRIRHFSKKKSKSNWKIKLIIIIEHAKSSRVRNWCRSNEMNEWYLKKSRSMDGISLSASFPRY